MHRHKSCLIISRSVKTEILSVYKFFNDTGTGREAQFGGIVVGVKLSLYIIAPALTPAIILSTKVSLHKFPFLYSL